LHAGPQSAAQRPKRLRVLPKQSGRHIQINLHAEDSHAIFLCPGQISLEGFAYCIGQADFVDLLDLRKE
jgi:hypothetical protein